MELLRSIGKNLQNTATYPAASASGQAPASSPAAARQPVEANEVPAPTLHTTATGPPPARPHEDRGERLRAAVRAGDASTVTSLLDQGADINEGCAEIGRTPLFMAAQEGHAGLVQLLLDRGAAINQPLNDGTTPICIAAVMDRMEAARALLQRGADVELTRNTGATPFYLAARRRKQAMVQLLMDHSKGRPI